MSTRPIVDPAAEIAGFADHGRAGGALDGGLDFGLGGCERPFDDLDQDRISDGHCGPLLGSAAPSPSPSPASGRGETGALCCGAAEACFGVETGYRRVPTVYQDVLYVLAVMG